MNDKKDNQARKCITNTLMVINSSRIHTHTHNLLTFPHAPLQTNIKSLKEKEQEKEQERDRKRQGE